MLTPVAMEVYAQKTTLVYTADQNSNTVTVIDVDKQLVLGTIVLGYPSSDPKVFHPLYNGDINVHGINFDPVNKKIAVTSTVSNSITVIDAETAQIVKRTYVGRNPHEPRFTKDGKEIWVTIRGENYIAVLDAKTLEEKTRIILSEGPGMVAFSNDGNTAYVCSSFDNNFWIINVRSKKIIKTLTVPSNFSPFVNVSSNGAEAWVTHKDTGMVTRIDTRTNSIIESFNTGKITNHVGFSDHFYFVTVGGENKVKVYSLRKDNKAILVREINTDDLPHGIWYNNERDEIYVVTELGNTMQILDAKKFEIKKTLPVGERPQALIPCEVESSVETIVRNLNSTRPVFKGPKN